MTPSRDTHARARNQTLNYAHARVSAAEPGRGVSAAAPRTARSLRRGAALCSAPLPTSGFSCSCTRQSVFVHAHRINSQTDSKTKHFSTVIFHGGG